MDRVVGPARRVRRERYREQWLRRRNRPMLLCRPGLVLVPGLTRPLEGDGRGLAILLLLGPDRLGLPRPILRRVLGLAHEHAHIGIRRPPEASSTWRLLDRPRHVRVLRGARARERRRRRPRLCRPVPIHLGQLPLLVRGVRRRLRLCAAVIDDLRRPTSAGLLQPRELGGERMDRVVGSRRRCRSEGRRRIPRLDRRVRLVGV